MNKVQSIFAIVHHCSGKHRAFRRQCGVIVPLHPCSGDEVGVNVDEMLRVHVGTTAIAFRMKAMGGAG